MNNYRITDLENGEDNSELILKK